MCVAGVGQIPAWWAACQWARVGNPHRRCCSVYSHSRLPWVIGLRLLSSPPHASRTAHRRHRSWVWMGLSGPASPPRDLRTGSDYGREPCPLQCQLALCPVGLMGLSALWLRGWQVAWGVYVELRCVHCTGLPGTARKPPLLLMGLFRSPLCHHLTAAFCGLC